MTKPPKYHKPKKFLKLPHISGGKEELKKFIRENLQYPQKALEDKVQGDVIVKYKINDNGDVMNPEIIKGIGHGCDEEAIRLVMMLQYDPVKNRGTRVTASNKLKIPFRLPNPKTQQKINVMYTPAAKDSAKEKIEAPGEEKPKPQSYSYTVKLKP